VLTICEVVCDCRKFEKHCVGGSHIIVTCCLSVTVIPYRNLNNNAFSRRVHFFFNTVFLSVENNYVLNRNETRKNTEPEHVTLMNAVCSL
jgi:hypothetical protein